MQGSSYRVVAVSASGERAANIRACLESAGIHPEPWTTAHSAAEAVAALSQAGGTPEIVVIDASACATPEDDTSLLCRTWPGAAMVCVSLSYAPDDAERLLNAGAADCLGWDELDAARLGRAVHHALARARCQPAAENAANHALHAAAAEEIIGSHAADMISLHTLTGDYLYASAASESLFGYTADDLTGQAAYSFVHPDDIETVRRTHEQILSGQGLHTVAYRYRCADRAWRWVETTSKSVRDRASGAPSEIICVTRDISARKEAESTLRRNAEFLETLLDTIPCPVFYKDAAGRYQGCNRRFAEQVLGIEKGAIVGRAVLDLADQLSEPLARRYAEHDARAMASGGVQVYETEVICAGGEVRDFIMYKAPYYEQGRVAGLVGVMLDVTERRAAEEANARLAKAVESAAESIVITDVAGCIQYVNPAFERVTGYAKHEAVGQNPRILKSGRQPESFYRDMWQTLLSGTVWRGTFVNRRKDGGIYTEEGTISPIFDASGSITNFVAVKRDVTRELDLERQMHQTQKLEAIGTLAGGIAHEFNNILSSVLGYTELALSDAPPGTQLHADLETVLSAGYRARDLVQQILSFSRRSEGERTPLLLTPVVKEAMKLLRASIPATVVIEVDVPEELPLVEADLTQIHQVIMNLGTNAYQALGPDGGAMRVRVAPCVVDESLAAASPDLDAGNYVCISIADDGCGMTPELMEHLFEPFFTTRAQGEGSGLGLAATHGIVRAHGGAIRVRSTHGEGSEFSVYLPAMTEPKARPAAAPDLRRASERILLVDDEELIALLAQRILEKAGYCVTVMTSSMDAWALFETQPESFDCLVTDLAMPNLAGRELIQRVRALRPGLPCVVMSGFSAGARSGQMEGLGANNFVQKPLNRHKLLEAVGAALDTAANSRQA